MNRNEQLYENYEDALFKLLMNNVAEAEGARLIEENELLKNTPGAAVPEEIDEACLRAIWRKTGKARKKTRHISVWTVLQRVAVVVIVLVALFMVAYAASPEFRVGTLNLLIEASNVRSQLNLMEAGMESNSTVTDETPKLMGYALTNISADFFETGRGEDRLGAWVKYANDDGATIRIKITKASVLYVDTEDADNTVEISIHDYKGVITEKDGTIRICWYDSDNDYYIDLTCVNLGQIFAQYLAEGIVFVGD